MTGSKHLLEDLGDDPRADGPTTLTDSEPKSLVHGDRVDQLDLHLDVVSGITISVPSGRLETPVTSVVRK